ncbi:MAG: TetR/AcrR family transcriptional regulator [Ruminococcus sp.]|nr:TetR/AcrR family transcriptional regulator [Ruminococcus sp.]
MRTAEEIERTKQSLIDALFELMAQKDYQSITMSEVANTAGYGRATLYRHFQSKEDMIKSYFEKNNAVFQDMKNIRITGREDFYDVIFSVFSALKDNKEIVKLLISAHLEFMYLEFMNTAMVRNYEQNGFIVSKYSPYYFMGSLFNVSMQWVRNDCEESVRQITDFYYNHLFNVKPML